MKTRVYTIIKNMLIKFFKLDIYVRRFVTILFMWFFLTSILKIKFNNFWLNSLYKYLEIDYFLQVDVDRLFFTLILAGFILFFTNKIKSYYTNFFSQKENQVDFEIKKNMRDIWFYEVNIYLYIFLFFITLQSVFNLFLDTKLLLFNTLLSSIIFIYYIFKLINLKYSRFEMIYYKLNKLEFTATKYSDTSMLKIIFIHTKTTFFDYIANTRIGQRFGSKMLTPDLRSELKDFSYQLKKNDRKISDMEKFLEIDKSQKVLDYSQAQKNEKRLSDIEKFLEINKNQKVLEYSRRALYQDFMLGVTTSVAAAGLGLAYTNHEISLENQTLKDKVAKLEESLPDLTEAAVKKHNEGLELKKSCSQNSTLSRESIQSSLNKDIEIILDECNGMPINGNSSLFKRKV